MEIDELEEMLDEEELGDEELAGARERGQRGGGRLRALLKQAMRDMRKRDFESAQTGLEQLLEAKPDMAVAHFAKGRLFYLKKQPRRAQKALERAVELKPDMVPAQVLLGNVLSELGDAEGALSHFEHALEQEPTQANAQMGMGKALANMESLEEAEQRIREALKSNPQLAPAYLALANVLSGQGDDEAALNALEQAITIKPAFWGSYFVKGRILLKTKRYAEALAAFEQVAKRKPDDAKIYVMMGMCGMGLEDFTLAEKSYSEALRLNPKLTSARLQHAKALMEQGRFDEARKPLQLLAKRRPTSAAVHRLLGELYLRMELYRESASEYRAVLMHAPSLVKEHPELIDIDNTEDDEARARAFRDAFAAVRLPSRKQGEGRGRRGPRRGRRGRGDKGNAIRLTLK